LDAHSSGLEIRPRRPRRGLKIGLLIGGVIVIVCAYLWGYKSSVVDAELLKEQLERQQLSYEERGGRIQQLKIKIVQLEQGRKVDAVAIQEVKVSLKEQQQEILELREGIAFYRGIVSPSEAKTGILIQRFELTPLAEKGLFHYRLVLTQVLKNERVAKGKVEVRLLGVLDGRSHQLSLSEVSDISNKAMKFRFKYFQLFEGDLILPEAFSPHTVEVIVKPQRSNSVINENFPWPSL